jgi:hypothetical protein
LSPRAFDRFVGRVFPILECAALLSLRSRQLVAGISGCNFARTLARPGEVVLSNTEAYAPHGFRASEIPAVNAAIAGDKKECEVLSDARRSDHESRVKTQYQGRCLTRTVFLSSVQ